MYSDDETENEKPSNSGNFYQNNKILVWVFIAIIILVIIFFLYKKISNKNTNNSNNNSSQYVVTMYPAESVTIPKGSSYKLAAVVDGVNSPIIVWSSSDEGVATVSDGNVVAIGYGKAVITATYTYNAKIYSSMKDITVADGDPNVILTDVSAGDGDLQLPVNGIYNINLTMNPSDGYITDKKFISSNENVVTVDSDGVVTPVAEGEATITIDINKGLITKTIKVYVNKDYSSSQMVTNPTTITINKDISEIKVGETAKLNYTIAPDAAKNAILTWSSSDESVLKVNNGVIEGIKVGKSTVRLSASNGVNDYVNIEVISAGTSVTSIEYPLSVIYLEKGATDIIKPTVLPEDAVDKNITFSVSDTSVFNVSPTVGESTVIAALNVGTATLTMTSGTISKTITVAVVEANNGSNNSGGSGNSGGSSCASCSKVTCSAGKYCNCGKCVSCPQGYYCANNQKTACPDGKSSVPNSSSYQDCYVCSKGYYISNRVCVACPSGYTTKSSGSTSKSDCNVKTEQSSNTEQNNNNNTEQNNNNGTGVTSCNQGQYVSNGKCETCPQGKYCKDGKNTYNCPAGKGKASGAKFYVNCLLCDSGYISSAGGKCTKCASGKSNGTRTKCVD